MIDQPLVGIIYIYKLFFIALMSALTKIKQDTFLSKFILISNPSQRWNRSLPDLSYRDGSLKNTI